MGKTSNNSRFSTANATLAMPRRLPQQLSRRGTTSNLALWVLSALAILAALGWMLMRLDRQGRPVAGRDAAGRQEPLFVYCAAGIRYPVEEVVRQYEEQFGVSVQLQYGGSNTLLNQLEVSRTGDLYLAADNSYLELAREKGLAEEIIPLAKMKPVIAVSKDNPKNIRSVDDLLRADVKVALGNPEAAAVGKKARKLLTASGQWEALQRHVTSTGVFKPTVNEVANDIKLGSVDAGIIWDATAVQYAELVGIDVPELDAGLASIGISVLQSSLSPTSALHFARFLGARDEGLTAFQEYGFEVVDGDVWEDVPTITFFAGAINRRALEPVLNEFEQREGVQISTSYNGCGILTATMRTLKRDQQSGFPDAFMACDVYYLETVQDWFQDDVEVSDTKIVIAVPKGNPRGIRNLKDLANPGVRLALGQPDQCTIGVLSRRLLQDAGIYDQLIESNVVTQSPSSAMLIPNVTTGTADAVLAYETDTLAERDKVEVIPIDSPLARAVQPYSISRSSDYKYMGRRLFEKIAGSRVLFEQAGFNWRLAKADSSQEAEATRP